MPVRTPHRLVVRAFACAAFVAAAVGACTCQREENVVAKQRLSLPAPPQASLEAAKETIDANNLVDKDVLKRVSRMDGTEVQARLSSFVVTSSGRLSFGREGQGALRSSEKTRVVQSDTGEFTIDVTAGDGAEQKVVYANEIFFLKNNNGKWRMSRDPRGERNSYRDDGVATWQSVYDLVAHTLQIEPKGNGSHDGRSVVKYTLKLPDERAAAVADGKTEPPIPVGPDGGPAEMEPQQKRERMSQRMAKWRKRARPAGGSGELWVDAETGVVLYAKLDGNLVVGDAPTPAELELHVESSITQIGKKHDVVMPKDAIEEIVRTKMPVKPRELLEEEGIVEPLPKDAGPGGVKTTPPPSSGVPPDEAGEPGEPGEEP